MVKIGEKAPEFSEVTAYHAGDFKKVSLADYKGKWLILFFYPRDFTFVCPTEIKEFSRFEKEFEGCNCAILACSTDSEWSHKNWFQRDLKEVRYPILADTTQKISESYNVLGPNGEAGRGTFIIDPEGVLRWMVVSDNSVGRSVKETFRSLKALQTGELCPAEWEEGQEPLKP
ncbi:peroxiredoxin [Patescibacteria group bacterium]|nr:peroxiredoxin [Patescibacteria group bacterium]